MQAVNTFNSPIGKAFGHYQEASCCPLDWILPIIRDLGNIIGYVPVIGSAVGLSRIISSTLDLIQPERQYPGYKAHNITLIVRGTLEFFCLGVLLLIPDLIFTIGRIFS